MSASKEMLEAERELAILGHTVTLPSFVHEYAEMENPTARLTESSKEKIENDLIRKYYEKIKECDAVLAVNTEKNGIKGYIGGNTFLEIGFAFVLHKPIYLLHDIPTMSYTDEIIAMHPTILRGDLSRITQ